MLRSAAAAIAIAIVACGCSGQTPVSARSNGASSMELNVAHLAGTEWRFVDVAGAPVPAAVTATMRLRDGRAGGKAGCNSYAARYRIDPDGAAAFQLGMSTKMACLEPAGAMQVERGVFAALRHTAKAEIVDGQLVLQDAAGKSLARLSQIGSR